MIWASGGVVCAGDGVDNKIDDGVSENRYNEADNGIEDSIFSVGDFFTIATGDNITQTTINEHNYRYNTDGV